MTNVAVRIKNGLIVDIISSAIREIPPDYIVIDSGDGTKYDYAQTQYFDGGLYTGDGISRYKLVDGAPVLRSEEEIAADRAAIPSPQPSETELLKQQVADLQNQLLTMRLGG